MNKQGGTEIIDSPWNDFVATVGTLYITGRVNNADQVIAGTTYTGFTRIGGSGVPDIYNATTGWYSLTPGGGYSALFSLSTIIPPEATPSVISVDARATSTTVLRLRTQWFQSNYPPGEETTISGGTATTSPFTAFGTAPAVLCTVITPSPFSGPLVNTWGTPTVNSAIT
jgi:hypothetical protein